MKLRCTIEYPWAGVEPDEEIINIPDDAIDEIVEIANETIEEMLYNRVSISWEVLNG